jgi:hypothetical protein
VSSVLKYVVELSPSLKKKNFLFYAGFFNPPPKLSFLTIQFFNLLFSETKIGAAAVLPPTQKKNKKKKYLQKNTPVVTLF